MARRTKTDALKTRTAILDCAEVLFFRHGFAAVTLDEIAREAGVTKGAVYGHFKNKEEVLFALLGRVDFAFEGERLKEHAETGIPAIRQEMQQIFVNVATDSQIKMAYAILMHKVDGTDDHLKLRQRREVIERECEAFLRYHWQMAAAAGTAPADMDIKMACHLFRSYIIGLLDIWIFNPALFDLNAEAEHLTETYIRMASGMKPRARLATTQALVAA